jgi:hypothetical protein
MAADSFFSKAALALVGTIILPLVHAEVRHGNLRTETVCQLFETRGDPSPDRVRVIAQVEFVIHHGAWLEDPACPRSAVALRLPDGPPNGSKEAAFGRELLTGGGQFASRRVFNVEIVGEMKAAAADQPTPLFWVESVVSFKRLEPKP